MGKKKSPALGRAIQVCKLEVGSVHLFNTIHRKPGLERAKTTTRAWVYDEHKLNIRRKSHIPYLTSRITCKCNG